MDSTPSSRRRRWAVPAVVAAGVAGAVALPAVLVSAGPPDLAPRSAAQLLVDLSEPDTRALSGTVVQTSRLGLPELPDAGGETGPMSLTSGSNTLRVWADGPDRARVALLGQLAEYDVVRNGRDVWTYSSERDEAVHYVLPERPAGGGAEPEAPVAPGLPTTPAEAADALLAAIDPTTEVRVDDDVEVAGRAARQLVLTPRDRTSLITSVRLAVDDETSAPLRVQVFSARDAELPAFDVGFSDVDLSAPDASVFSFTAPPGADLREVEVPAGGGPDGPSADAVPPAGARQAPAGPRPEVVGQGWTSVLVLAGLDATGLADAQPALLDSLTTRVPEGRLLSTALVSVLLTDDGRLLVGAVTPEALRAAA